MPKVISEDYNLLMSWQILVGLSIILFSVNGLIHRVIMKDSKSDAGAQAFML